MGRLGPDRGRGRPGRPARPGPQVRTSPTAPARAAWTRAGDVASWSARAAGTPRSRTWPASSPVAWPRPRRRPGQAAGRV